VTKLNDARGDLPFRNVKLLPGSMPLTTPRSCAPGGELSVTNMVSPIKVFDMSGSVSSSHRVQVGRALILSYSGRRTRSLK
jgi:hypothetical protein